MKKDSEGRKERRKFLRIPFWAEVRFRVCKPPKEVLSQVNIVYPEHRRLPENDFFSLGKSRNISAGGLLFDSPKQIQLGDFLEMDISISPYEDPIRLRGRVVRVKQGTEKGEYQIAVSFISEGEEETNRIAEFVNKYYV